MLNPKHLICLALALVLASGCQSLGDRNPREARALAQAMKELNVVRGKQAQISTFRMTGWRPINDTNLVMTAGQHRHYLVELMAPCLELRTAFGIGFDTTFGGTVTRFDEIIVSSLHGEVERCRIREIYELEHPESPPRQPDPN